MWKSVGTNADLWNIENPSNFCRLQTEINCAPTDKRIISEQQIVQLSPNPTGPSKGLEMELGPRKYSWKCGPIKRQCQKLKNASFPFQTAKKKNLMEERERSGNVCRYPLCPLMSCSHKEAQRGKKRKGTHTATWLPPVGGKGEKAHKLTSSNKIWLIGTNLAAGFVRGD